VRGQSSLELVILIIFSILLLFVFLAGLQHVEAAIDFERHQVLAKEVLRSAASEIDGAAVMGDGYVRAFMVPARLRDGTNFSLSILPAQQRLTIEWGDSGGSSSQKILTSQLSGNFTHGAHLIRNSKGTVFIEAAP